MCQSASGAVDIEALIRFLETSAGRIDEIRLLRFVRLPNASGSEELDLFRRHFELYHALYLLGEHGIPGRRLHIGMAHVVVSIADTHATEANDATDSLCESDARSYYLDRRNMQRMDASGLKQLMDGVLQAATHHEELVAAAQTLQVGLHVTPRRLQERFRFLVKTCHPDAGGDPRTFRELYAAYQLIQTHLQLCRDASQTAF